MIHPAAETALSETYEPDFSDELLRLHLSRAAVRMPGPEYYEALSWIHEETTPGTYLEIGVRDGASLRVANPATQCVGIDPAPQLRSPVTDNVHIFEMTSDGFFADVSLEAIWPEGHFDLGFIDGLHLFEQALRDFVNLERHTTEQSIIMIHDCLPLDEITASRSRKTQFYSGDTWKLIHVLGRFRPDLRMAMVAAPPTGLCLVTHCDSESVILDRDYNEIVNTYVPLGFEHHRALPVSLSNLVENTPEAIKNCIRSLRGSANKQ